MSAAAQILADARASGIQLRLVDDELHMKRQAEPPDPALLDRLRAHKAEIMDLLLVEAWRSSPVGKCRACGWIVPLAVHRCPRRGGRP